MAVSLYEEAFLFYFPLLKRKRDRHFKFPLLITEGVLRDACLWSHGHFSYLFHDACMWSHGQHKYTIKKLFLIINICQLCFLYGWLVIPVPWLLLTLSFVRWDLLTVSIVHWVLLTVSIAHWLLLTVSIEHWLLLTELYSQWVLFTVYYSQWVMFSEYN